MSDSRHGTQPAPIARRVGALREALEDKGLLPDGFLDGVEAGLAAKGRPGRETWTAFMTSAG